MTADRSYWQLPSGIRVRRFGGAIIPVRPVGPIAGFCPDHGVVVQAMIIIWFSGLGVIPPAVPIINGNRLCYGLMNAAAR